MQRVQVTHAGSLIRPPEPLAYLSAMDHGRASADNVEYQAALARAVAHVVRRQAETGIDIIDDGEMGKSTWITYLYERTAGLESRPLQGTSPLSSRPAGTGRTSPAPTASSTCSSTTRRSGSGPRRPPRRC